MTLPLNPERIAAAYDFLNVTPPFDKWNLPDSDDLIFRVAKSDLDHGWITTGRRHKKPVITISGATTGQTPKLFETLAHEMVHLHQYLTRQPQTHGPGFRKMAELVCKYHGFDPKAF